MKISVIDDKLSIYRGKQVVLWGTGGSVWYIYEFLNSNKINIIAFCDNNAQKWGGKLHNIEIISPERLKEMYFDSKCILVQIATSTYEDEISLQLDQMGIMDYVSFREASWRFQYWYKFDFFKYNPQLYKHYLDNIYPNKYIADYNIWERLFFSNIRNREFCVFTCMPMKTGDYTVMYTLQAAGIPFIALSHSFHYFTPEIKSAIKGKKIKLITAVREPIAQNISLIFQILDRFWDRQEFWQDGGDIWKILNLHIKEEIEIENNHYLDKENLNVTHRTFDLRTTLIQHFFEIQYKNGLGIDLFDYEFNREKGYGVVKSEDLEIFIYQLEKLNDVYKDLLQFCECEYYEEVKLINGNESKNKWYYKYYCEALKEIKFPKEYFDWCYDSPYIKHFYSTKDIETFKDKWKSHIL